MPAASSATAGSASANASPAGTAAVGPPWAAGWTTLSPPWRWTAAATSMPADSSPPPGGERQRRCPLGRQQLVRPGQRDEWHCLRPGGGRQRQPVCRRQFHRGRGKPSAYDRSRALGLPHIPAAGPKELALIPFEGLKGWYEKLGRRGSGVILRSCHECLHTTKNENVAAIPNRANGIRGYRIIFEAAKQPAPEPALSERSESKGAPERVAQNDRTGQDGKSVR